MLQFIALGYVLFDMWRQWNKSRSSKPDPGFKIEIHTHSDELTGLPTPNENEKSLPLGEEFIQEESEAKEDVPLIGSRGNRREDDTPTDRSHYESVRESSVAEPEQKGRLEETPSDKSLDRILTDEEHKKKGINMEETPTDNTQNFTEEETQQEDFQTPVTSPMMIKT